MNFVYVTDLHGWAAGYQAVLTVARMRGVNAIVNGGDLLPKGSGILELQKRFLRHFLPDYLRQCADAGICYYGMFGNDDCRSRLPYWAELLGAHQNLVDLTSGWHDLGEDLHLRGVNYVPDHPFGLKDWSVADARGAPVCSQLGRAMVSGPEGFSRIPELAEFLAGRPTLADLLADISQDMPAARRCILVAHAPPAGCGLAVLHSGKDVGSASLRQWIEEQQPLLTLHGHIHESPDVSGVHTAYLGKTVCHQPGQKAEMALTVSMIEIGADDREVFIERMVTPV